MNEQDHGLIAKATSRDLAAVAFTILGVWLLVRAALSGLAFLVTVVVSGLPEPHQTAVYLLPLSTYAVLGLLFVSFRYALANSLFASSASELPTHAAAELVAVAFGVLGAFFVVTAAVDAAELAAHALLSQLMLEPFDRAAMEEGIPDVEFWSTALGLVAKLVLGIVLFSGSRGLARIWTDARSLGGGRGG